jgi:putative alpha-1,2-mannosidase
MQEFSDSNPSLKKTGFVDELGALFTFEPAPNGKTTILARVGVSFISTGQACANAEEEIPDFDFDKVHSDARAQWNDLLGRVQVDTTGVPKETVQLFYSSVRSGNLLKAIKI